MPIHNLEIIKEIITIIADCIASYVAIAGLSLWRKQLKGKSEYDLARRYLIAVYKLRDALFNVRSPFKSIEEIISDVNENNKETNSIERTYRTEFLRRWKQAEEVYLLLNVELFEAEVLWGYEARQVAEQFIFCYSQIYLSSRLQTENNVIDKKNVLLSSINLDDDFSQKIYSEVVKIENYLRKHLK